MSVFLLGLGSFVALAWTALALRLVSKLSSFRLARPRRWSGGRVAEPVEAVVPAHNEEREIEATVRDLLAQDYPGLTLTIVDDQSTDATGSILDRLATELDRVRVVHGVERPGGWVGKTWAVTQGVRQTSADWLLFVDADMRLHPNALSTAMAEAEEADADLLSFLPRGDCRTFWQVAVGLTLAQVLSQLYPLDRVNDPTRPEALAAGGFILVRRAAYERAGEHEAVRSEIVDDILLARKVKASGGRLLVLPAPELAWTHMYGTVADIWRGLRKNAYAGMDYQFHKYATGVVVALLMAWAPWASLVAGISRREVGLIGVGAWGILAQAAVSFPIARFLRISPLLGFSLPLGISLYVGIATSSVRHHLAGRILWKGRAMQTSEIFAPVTDGVGKSVAE